MLTKNERQELINTIETKEGQLIVCNNALASLKRQLKANISLACSEHRENGKKSSGAQPNSQYEIEIKFLQNVVKENEANSLLILFDACQEKLKTFKNRWFNLENNFSKLVNREMTKTVPDKVTLLNLDSQRQRLVNELETYKESLRNDDKDKGINLTDKCKLETTVAISELEKNSTTIYVQILESENKGLEAALSLKQTTPKNGFDILSNIQRRQEKICSVTDERSKTMEELIKQRQAEKLADNLQTKAKKRLHFDHQVGSITKGASNAI